MLVLSRHRDESVMIGDDIEVKVIDIRGDKVRLGFTAPTQISVHRKEVYDAIRREQESHLSTETCSHGVPWDAQCDQCTEGEPE